MKVCIICYGLNEFNVRLQPWRYLLEIAKGLTQNSMNVKIITDGTSIGMLYNIPIIYSHIRTLPFIKNRNLISIINAENPDVVLWSISPLDYLYLNSFKSIKSPIIGLFTCPIYNISEIARLGIKDLYENLNIIFLHILYALSPQFFTRKLINSNYIKKVFVMSHKNEQRLVKMGVNKSKIAHIPVGIDEYDLLKPDSCDSIKLRYNLDSESFYILYLGSPSSIRGIDMIIEAMVKVKNNIPTAKLLILSRHKDGELEAEVDRMNKLIHQLKLENYVQIISGFLDKEDIKKFILLSDIIALPFKIVPSDMPISILEAMALGKPVISTNVDGIPELIGDGRGIIVEPNDLDALTDNILSCLKNPDTLQKFGNKSLIYMQSYPRWSDVTMAVIKEINNIR